MSDTRTSGPKHLRRAWWRNPWMAAIAVLAVLVGGGAIALVAVDGPTHTDGPHASPPATAAGPSGPACPLSGTAAPGGAVPDRPALAIKVDNYPTARPQAGLDRADIVFEEPVEGGITRLVAVFQCKGAPLVGPIRSARQPDLGILDQLSKPLFVHAGGIDPVLALLRSGNLYDENVFVHASIIQHPPGRYAPYDTYVSTTDAWGLQPKDTSPPAPLFSYSTTPPAGTPVASVHIPFSQTSDVTWTWAAASNDWVLSYSGVRATVASGTPIAVANVVVMTVHVTNGPWLENDMGGLEVQVDATSGGPVQVLRNGEVISGRWSRASLLDPTQLLDPNGAPIPLAPGETWVELVPVGIPVTTAAPAPST